MAPSFVSPPPLEKGDIVGAVAPSGEFSREKYEAGIDLVRAAGFEVKEFLPSAPLHYLAGADEERLRSVQDALDDDEVKALWCARGGYGAARIAAKVRLPKEPKWLIGFSDATALHARWQGHGWTSLHAANLTTLSSWGRQQRTRLWELLRQGPGERSAWSYRLEPLCAGRTESGPLVGGNLTVLASMAGSGLLPSAEGRWIVLEDVTEAPYRLDRSINQLMGAGFFDGVRGVILGQFTRCDPPEGASYSLDDVLKRCLGALDEVPVVKGLPVGHDADSFPVLLGQGVHVSADLQEAEFRDG